MSDPKKIVTINARKYSGVIHRSWKAELISRDENLLTFIGCFTDSIQHPNLGIIRRGTISYEYYWLDRWYNVFRFHEPEGDLRNFYCNINMPPKFDQAQLDYIDFDIDVLVWKDFSFEVLDVDEFDENFVRYKYPPEIRHKVFDTLDEVLSLIGTREFPFSETEP